MTTELWGLHEAEVFDVDDPQGLSRIAVRIRSVLGESELWAEPSVATSSTPDLGARVWVQFASGDASRPVYLASVVNDAALADILRRLDALEAG
jgi:hypothetical protein